MKKLKFKIIFIFAIFFVVLLLPKISWAATINAASCSQVDIQNAINASVNGDIVSVPAGSCAWSSEVSIPNTKKITLQGAGKTLTLISGSRINMNKSGSRVTGFGFTPTAGAILVDGDGWIIDNNNFTYSARTYAINVNGGRDALHPTGLIHGNTFTNGAIVVFGFCADAGPDSSSGQWALPVDFGGATNVVYVEDNTFTSGQSSVYYTDCVDSNCGGRYVFRYNTVMNSDTDNHGVQSYNNRASMRTEIYNNSYTNSAANRWLAIYIRGGSNLVFNNTFNSGYNYPIVIDNQTSCRYGTYTVGVACSPGAVTSQCSCDGNNSRDGNRTGLHGYPCRDQIGRGQDVPRWSVGQPYTQELSPFYSWNNKKNGSDISVLASWDVNCSRNTEHLAVNRDYYYASGAQVSSVSPFDGTTGVGYGLLINRPTTCTTNADETGGGVAYWATDENILYRCSATNTWIVHYKPYTYPHPLRVEAAPPPDTTPPAAPSGVFVN